MTNSIRYSIMSPPKPQSSPHFRQKQVISNDLHIISKPPSKPVVSPLPIPIPASAPVTVRRRAVPGSERVSRRKGTTTTQNVPPNVRLVREEKKAKEARAQSQPRSERGTKTTATKKVKPSASTRVVTGRHPSAEGRNAEAISNDETTWPYCPSLERYYAIGDTLGKGTFSVVKAAVHRLTSVRVAVKILDKSKMKNRSDWERIKREIFLLKVLNAQPVKHENVIELYEIISIKSHLFLVMEWSAMGELFDEIVRNSRFTERQACEYFHQLVNGLAFCHQLKIIHRDLKPENLLLSATPIQSEFLRNYDSNIDSTQKRIPTKTLKIIDFGLGIRTVAPTAPTLTTACGSPCYAPPEMLEGQKYAGTISDIWSCGVILYAMVCGFLPFEHENTVKLYEKITTGDYEMPMFLSTDCQDLISKILCVSPQDRITIPQIRNHRWYRQLKLTSDPVVPVLSTTSATQRKQPLPSFRKEVIVTRPRGNSHSSPRRQESIDGENDDIFQQLESQHLFNEEVLQCMIDAGYQRKIVIKSVIEHKFDHLHATYALLLVREKLNVRNPELEIKAEVPEADIQSSTIAVAAVVATEPSPKSKRARTEVLNLENKVQRAEEVKEGADTSHKPDHRPAQPKKTEVFRNLFRRRKTRKRISNEMAPPIPMPTISEEIGKRDRGGSETKSSSRHPSRRSSKTRLEEAKESTSDPPRVFVIRNSLNDDNGEPRRIRPRKARTISINGIPNDIAEPEIKSERTPVAQAVQGNPSTAVRGAQTARAAHTRHPTKSSIDGSPFVITSYLNYSTALDSQGRQPRNKRQDMGSFLPRASQ